MHFIMDSKCPVLPLCLGQALLKLKYKSFSGLKTTGHYDKAPANSQDLKRLMATTTALPCALACMRASVCKRNNYMKMLGTVHRRNYFIKPTEFTCQAYGWVTAQSTLMLIDAVF